MSGVTPEAVFAAVSGATSVNTGVRSRAETSLRQWEADAAPGFLMSLLQIVQHTALVDEASCVVLACGSATRSAYTDDSNLICRTSVCWRLSSLKMRLAARGGRHWAAESGRA